MAIQQLVRLGICSSAFIHHCQPSFRQHLNLHLIQRSRCNSRSYISGGIDLEAMPRGVKKENLPVKTCVVCGRPFNWRKKWEKVWDEVTTCSKSCNRKRKEKNNRTTDDINIGGKESDSDEKEQLSNDIDFLESDFDDKEQLLDSIRDDMLTLNIGNVEDIKINDDDGDDSSMSSESETITDVKAKRKAEKKRKKAERRAQREGRGDPTAGQKQCTLCSKSVNLLIRCQHDKSLDWAMVCGKCWIGVSGGVVDGDDAHPYYRYGGLWKNRRAQT